MVRLGGALLQAPMVRLGGFLDIKMVGDVTNSTASHQRPPLANSRQDYIMDIKARSESHRSNSMLSLFFLPFPSSLFQFKSTTV